MKKYVIIIVGLLGSWFAAGAQQDTAYVRTFGGDQSEEGRAVIECSDGGYLAVGATGSDDGLSTNFYLLRLNKTVDCLWSKSWGGSGVEQAYSVVETDNGDFLVCGFTNAGDHGAYDALVVRFNHNGDEVWSKSYGGEDWDFGYKIIAHPAGGFLVLGETWSAGNGESDAAVWFINEAGDVLNEWTFGSTGSDKFTDALINQAVSGEPEILLSGQLGADENATHDRGWIVRCSEGLTQLNELVLASDTGDMFISGIDYANAKLHFAGNHIGSGHQFGIRGHVDDQSAQMLFISAPSSEGSFNWNDVVAKGDSTMYPGMIDFIGGGGQDAIAYMFNDWNFIGAPTYGSSGDEFFISGTLTSDSAVVLVGRSESLNPGLPQLLCVKLTHMASGDYYQDFDFTQSCFSVDIPELNADAKEVVGVEIYDVSGRLIYRGAERSFCPQVDGVYVKKFYLKDGRYYTRPEFVHHLR